jgi:aminoglycoside phosphotransferase (APT) family kinase protein
MEPLHARRAVDAAMSIAVALGLKADDAAVLQNSNKLALRLLPCDVFARVAPMEHQHARFEIELARQLTRNGSPIAALEPRVAALGYERDGFEITLWTYYEPATPEVSPTAYATALQALHSGLREIDLPTPHFTDRVVSAEKLVSSRDLSPGLADADRELLASTLLRLRTSICDNAASDQMLHGEPHPGNVLSTADGPRFIDLETCCRGPVEFDLAHVPTAVSDLYPSVDEALVRNCRQLVLAMVAAWRWDPSDQFPNGVVFGQELVCVLRAGPPWPTIDEVFGQLDARETPE